MAVVRNKADPGGVVDANYGAPNRKLATSPADTETPLYAGEVVIASDAGELWQAQGEANDTWVSATITDDAGGGIPDEGGVPAGNMYPFAPQGVVFDGTTAIYRNRVLAGIEAAPCGIISYWERRGTTNGSLMGMGLAISEAETGHPDSNAIFWYLAPGSQSTYLDIADTPDYDEELYSEYGEIAFFEEENWVHILWAWTSNEANGDKTIQVAVNGILRDTTDNIYTSDNAFLIPPGYAIIGAEGWNISDPENETLSAPYEGEVAEFYINLGETLDLTDQDNIDLFINGRDPVDLGINGELPTGSVPAIYLSVREGNTAEDFATNYGVSGNFNVEGTLTLAATVPQSLPAFVPKGVNFDGFTTLVNQALVSAGDASALTISFWLRTDGTENDGQELLVTDPEGLWTHDFYMSHNHLNTGLASPDASTSFLWHEDEKKLPTDQWTHHLICFNTDGAAGFKNMQVFRNGCLVTNIEGDNGPAFMAIFNNLPLWIGGDGLGDNYIGDIAELWIMPGYYPNVDTLTVLSRFITTDGQPTYLGVSGAKVTGAAPPVYLSVLEGQTAAEFAINHGSGGDFEITGALTFSTDAPAIANMSPLANPHITTFGAWSMSRDLTERREADTSPPFDVDVWNGVELLYGQANNNSDDFQGTDPIAPLSATAGPLSRPCATFDGVDDVLSGVLLNHVIADGRNYICLTVSLHADDYANFSPIISGVSGGDTQIVIQAAHSSGEDGIAVGWREDDGIHGVFGAVTPGVHVVEVQMYDGFTTLYIDGVSMQANSFVGIPGIGLSGDFAIGGTLAGAPTPMKGSFFEMVICNGDILEVDRATIRARMASWLGSTTL